MSHGSMSNVVGHRTQRVKIFDGVVTTLLNVMHVSKLRRSLISFRVLDTLGYFISLRRMTLRISFRCFNDNEGVRW